MVFVLQVINIMICGQVPDLNQRLLLHFIQITSNMIRTSHYYILKGTEKPENSTWKLQMDSFVLAKNNNEKLILFVFHQDFCFTRRIQTTIKVTILYSAIGHYVMNFFYHWLKLYYENESDIAYNGSMNIFKALILLTKDQGKKLFLHSLVGKVTGQLNDPS